MGVTVSNSYDYYQPGHDADVLVRVQVLDGARVAPDDPLPNMVNGDSGSPKTTPAPWVTYTRAGCDVGNISVANTVLENNSINPGGDIANVYGNRRRRRRRSPRPCGRPTSSASPSTARRPPRACATPARTRRADPLPDEPGGYDGYSALFGAKYVNPAITGGAAAVNDLNGSPITDPAGNPGFPGFDACRRRPRWATSRRCRRPAFR